MNIKKFLQKLAEKDEEALLTEEDRLFCQQLAEQCEENERQRKTEKRNRKKKKGKLN